jgi:transcriptional regulator with XRE-family HTH domain
MKKTLDLGKKIRIARLLRGYSQENMATELRIRQQTYQLLENGETYLSRERLDEICKILKMDVAFIEVLDDIDFLNFIVQDYTRLKNYYVQN